MPVFHLKEVKGRATKRLFHRVPFLVYENDEEFIPYLENDIENALDRKKNKLLEKGESIRWVLLDEDNVPCGRIAAFHYYTIKDEHIGGAGFFECIDDTDAASVLFKTAEEFLKRNGIHKIQAPVNCGERDRFWGLLVDGFDTPSYRQNYNPPYYRELFEKNNYQKEFEQYHYAISLSRFPSERFEAIAQRTLKDGSITVRHYDSNNEEEFIRSLARVYNEAWAEHDFYKPVTIEAATDIFRSLRLVLEPDLLLLAYDGNRPVGVFLALLELNELFEDLEGDINLWDKILLYFKRKKIPITKVQSSMFGIVPEYRRKGIDAVLINAMAKELKKLPQLEFMELAWIGDFNTRMLSLMENLGALRTKTLFTYMKAI